MYARLPPEPQRLEPEIELFTDSQEGDTKPGISSYLDEFLSAIKIFGYLERPVFHELTRHMQTRRLIAGETFLLEEEKGFCLVVDGLLQIFVKQDRDAGVVCSMGGPTCQGCQECDGGSRNGGKGKYREAAFHDEEDEEENGNGYQLLTEVKNGAPMSSLFTILSLFTEDVRLRHEFDEYEGVGVASSSNGSVHGFPQHGPDTFGQDNPFSPVSDRPPSRTDSRTGHRMNRAPSGGFPKGPLPSVPPLSLNEDLSPGHRSRPPSPLDIPPYSQPQQDQGPRRGHRRTRSSYTKKNSVHPDLVARASVDTTIAVIPAAAFRRLTRIYPKATAHIVQVILTRFQRVTFLTAFSYLGLTSEVLRTEKFMNKYTMYVKVQSSMTHA